jgi:phosphatidylserine/phosphatidylglycerophosphate/cardiolipin synthase-like enzyme
MPAIYGKRPPWHDIQAAIRGPAIGDVEATFRERWCDPAALSHNPIRLVTSLVERDDLTADPIPDQTADPKPAGDHVVQVLRTYPYRLRGYPFARHGERSIARAYEKAIGQARRLIYLEDQYLWSTQIATVFAAALRREPELRMIAVIPLHPDTEGLTAQAEAIGRAQAVRLLRAAGGTRFAIYGLESPSGVPVYVHAKACVMDDVWTIIGSDNLNIRSWTHDSELSCAVMDGDGGTEFGRGLRLRLHREHLDRSDGDDADLVSPDGVFDAYRDSAARLDAWHERPDGPRPPGRLRAYLLPTVTGWRVPLARAMYRAICDPDGRPRAVRRARTF